MYSSEDIMQLVDLIIEIASPDKVILFGSYAYGYPDAKSDLDLLVITNGKDLSRDEHADLETALYLKRKQNNVKTRYDVFFQSERQVNNSAKNGGAFVDAIQKGKVVYERTYQQRGEKEEAKVAIVRAKQIMLEFSNHPKTSSFVKEAEEVHTKIVKANQQVFNPTL